MENKELNDQIIDLCHWVVRESKRKKNGFRNDLHLHLDRIKRLTSNSVRPDVVVPSEKEVKSDLIYHSYLDGKNKGWNECLSELRRLNPTIAFTELNHEK
jgi:hypothetical protein